MPSKPIIEDAYPLTPMQEGMLFHSLTAESNEVYIVQLCCRISGLNPNLWRQAWNRAIHRHPTLRTAFAWKSQKNPLQLVGSRVEMPLRESDRSGISGEEIARATSEWRANDRCRGYNLAQAPLMRAELIRVAEGVYHFLWSFHHILMDAWSGSMLLGEVLGAYEALLGGREPRRDPAPPFRDFVEWLRGRDHDASEKFWRKALEGFSQPVSIPFPAPGGPAGAARHGEEWIALDRVETRALQAFGRAHKLTTNTLSRAAWGLLLSRLTGQSDVMFGAAVSGRPPELRGVEEMVGLFVNTVPVRVNPAEGATVLSWLSRLQEEASEASQYQYGSLAEIMGYCDVGRGQPLFDSILIFENLPASLAPTERKSSLHIDQHRTYWLTSYPLSLMIVPGEQLKIQLSYDLRRYGTMYARQLLRHFTDLLRGMVERPHASPAAIPMLSEEDRRCVHWIGPSRPEFGGALAHELFIAQAMRTPERSAIITRDRSLSYSELEIRSHCVSASLAARGLGRGSRVGLCLQRSPEMLIALLGVLRAGAAYVPLDPSFPPSRLADSAIAVGCAAVITDIASRGAIESVPVPQLAITDLVSGAVGVSPDPKLRPEDPAYFIFTSGSSGIPKGVEIPHRALANLLLAMSEEPGISDDDRLLAVTTISFDIAGLELLLPLTAGAAVVVATKSEARDPESLMDLMSLGRVTILQATPATWHLLIDAGWKGSKNLTALCGGEELTRSLAAELLERSAAVWNLYGPTETTIWSTVERVSPGVGPVPLGRPIANTEIVLLGSDGQLVPPGIPGEICVGGLGLANGYVSDPALTLQKFVVTGLPGESESRLFRTGDMARVEPDSGLHYLGRRDSQVKIRGFRVETGEIESAIQAHASVGQAAVALREIRGSHTLVAYVVPQTGCQWHPQHLRDHLREQLPDYMVPGAFVVMDRLPESPNGKLDRNALPLPRETEPAPDRPAAPVLASPVKEIVEDLWRELLGLSYIERHSNFFVLGGHSLLAMRLVNRMNKALGLQLPVRIVFEMPTLACLMEAIESTMRRERRTLQDPIPTTDGAVAPLSFQQRRVWFIEHLQGDKQAYNLHAGLRVRGNLEAGIADRCLTEIVHRHAILRSRFLGREDGPVQVAGEPAPVSASRRDFRSLPFSERDHAATEYLRSVIARPFDLQAGPPLRPYLLQMDDEEHILMLVLHHIVADEWSMAILIEEFGRLYEAFQADRPSPLALLSVQYPDYALWQTNRATDPAVAQQLEYWRGRLHGVRAWAPPLARPRGMAQSFAGTSLFFQFPASRLLELKQMSVREGATLFVALLAAFRCLLYRYAGEDDIAIGTLVAGRDRPEFEPLVGFFSNTLALRNELSADLPFRSVLRRELEGVLGAWANQGPPFEQIVDALKLTRDASRNPVFQIMFVLQNTPSANWEFGGLRVSPVLLDSGTVEFDMLLELYEEPAGLRVRLSYAAGLFEESEIQRMGEQYLVLLEAISQHPETPVASIPLVRPEDRNRAIRAFNESLEAPGGAAS